MSERIDHAARAEALLQSSEASLEGTFAAAAQAEATLALAEQQRIANLIALAESSSPILGEQVAPDTALCLEITAALGLEESTTGDKKQPVQSLLDLAQEARDQIYEGNIETVDEILGEMLTYEAKPHE